MAKRLEPISDLLESLPKPLSKQTSEFATKLLSKAIDVRHCEKKVTFYNNNPAILPTPIKFKFKLTCKSDYEENSIFKVEAARSAKIMDETRQSLRECIVRVMEMEYSGAIINLQKCFIEGILELLSYWICYHKGCYPEKCPPFSDDEGTEALLQMYFKSAPPEIFEYLGTDKTPFIEKMVSPCSKRIKYINDDDMTEDKITCAEEFKNQQQQLSSLISLPSQSSS